jgi:hypothetical protein
MPPSSSPNIPTDYFTGRMLKDATQQRPNGLLGIDLEPADG